MRRKLDYQPPEPTDNIAGIGSLNKGDWHVHKCGRLSVSDVLEATEGDAHAED